MNDIVLITIESLRYDYHDACPVLKELDTIAEGITTGHYTRPALAGLLSGQYRAALAAEPRSPTLTSVLTKVGYSTAMVSYSPQTADVFGFTQGFDRAEHVSTGSKTGLSRGSQVREWLGQFDPVRRLHRQFKPKHATMNALPTDEEAISDAISTYSELTRPRFLWVHLMGSHRPYGWGDEALDQDIDRHAAAASPARWTPTISERERAQIVQHYTDSLERVSARVSRLLGAVDSDARVVICGDHGEEFGEAGYYYHGGYRRRTADALIRVPVATRGVPLPEQVGLIDLPRRLARAAGATVPDDWDGRAGDGWLTIAPWHDRASVAYTTDETTLRFSDAEIEKETDVTGDRQQDVAEQLQALGYADVG